MLHASGPEGKKVITWTMGTMHEASWYHNLSPDLLVSSAVWASAAESGNGPSDLPLGRRFHKRFREANRKLPRQDWATGHHVFA